MINFGYWSHFELLMKNSSKPIKKMTLHIQYIEKKTFWHILAYCLEIDRARILYSVSIRSLCENFRRIVCSEQMFLNRNHHVYRQTMTTMTKMTAYFFSSSNKLWNSQ